MEKKRERVFVHPFDTIYCPLSWSLLQLPFSKSPSFCFTLVNLPQVLIPEVVVVVIIVVNNVFTIIVVVILVNVIDSFLFPLIPLCLSLFFSSFVPAGKLRLVS